MKNKKARIALSYFLIALMLGLALFPSTAEAYLDTETILKMNLGSVDGVGRRLILAKNEWDQSMVYFEPNFEEGAPFGIYEDPVLDVGFDKYGIVQVLCPEKYVLWWSYDLTPDLAFRDFYSVPNANDPEGYMHDIESFVFEGEGFEETIVGYRSTSGQFYPLPSFDEMKEIAGLEDNPLQPPTYVAGYTPIPEIPGVETWSIETSKPSPTVVPPTPTPVVTPSEKPDASALPTSVPPTREPEVSEEPMPTPTLAPPTSEPSPTEKPSESPTPISTSKPKPSPSLVPPTQAPSVSTSAPLTNPPSVVVQPTATPKVSKKLDIKTSKKKGKTTYSLCEGDKKVIEYTLFKGNLTWKAGKKKGKASGVRYAGFIKKSRNLYYGDKKGRGYTISSKNGKKKLIIKKGAKKPIYSAKFIVKVKVASKPINISNK